MGNLSPDAKVRIIGVGNILLKDEGVGVRIAEGLMKRRWPPAVEVIEGGVAGLGLLDYFTGASKVLLVDAAEMGRAPGTVVRFSPAEVRLPEENPKFSMHEVNLRDVLGIAQHLFLSPMEIVIFGVQPKEISWGMELSPEIEAAVPRGIEMVEKELERMGIHPSD
jgi:hydrogenase maturation protease